MSFTSRSNVARSFTGNGRRDLVRDATTKSNAIYHDGAVVPKFIIFTVANICAQLLLPGSL